MFLFCQATGLLKASFQKFCQQSPVILQAVLLTLNLENPEFLAFT